MTDQLILDYTLDETKLYLIQFTITTIQHNYCLPYLQINTNNHTYNDTIGYSMKYTTQYIYITNSTNITIQVTCIPLKYFSQINKTMNFNLSITEVETIQQRHLECQFPLYGPNCNLQIQQLQTNFEFTIEILNNTWFFAYTILDNIDYEIRIDNKQLFGISAIPADKVNNTILPSFLTNFQIIDPKNENIIKLKRDGDIQDFIFIIGLFNFNTTNIQEIKIIFQSLIKEDSFPIWAILLLISIILVGGLLFIIILCSYKRQYKKLTQPTPALDRKILKKYMSPQKIDAKMINEAFTCSVCLLQFEIKEQYCRTPCQHFFHQQCLSDWTTKQANCPVCRQGLKEDEIKKYLTDKISGPKNHEQQQSVTDRNIVGFLPLTSTPCRIELDQSPQAEHSPQFDGSPQNNTNRGFCFQSDGIIESQN